MKSFTEWLKEHKLDTVLDEKSFHLNPEHKGWCTPMSKPTCTGKRRAFAKEAKAGVFDHKADK